MSKLFNVKRFDPKTGGERHETHDGFSVFNRCPHLGVEVPDGDSTITCRTSDGELITFAFLRAKQGDGPPTCVDVHHVSGRSVMFDDRTLHRQLVMVSGPGKVGHLDKLIAWPVTLTTLIMQP
jgi:hypothetical protein